MTVLDKRSEEMSVLDARISAAPTMRAWLNLVQEKHVLGEQLRGDLAHVNRLAQGWTYIPPPKLR